LALILRGNHGQLELADSKSKHSLPEAVAPVEPLETMIDGLCLSVISFFTNRVVAQRIAH